MSPLWRVAVLASGRGSNLQALLDAPGHGQLFRIVGVYSDRPACAALRLARERGIPAVGIKPADHPSRESFDEAMFRQIEGVQPDLIVCAGYMRLISAAAVQRFQGRLINIHPSLLPKYPGLDTHARALAAGDAEHGASVHCVIPALDAGPVFAQARVAVLPGEDAQQLAARVLAREHPLLVQGVQAIADGRLRISGEGFLWKGRPLTSPLLLDSNDLLEEPQCSDA